MATINNNVQYTVSLKDVLSSPINRAQRNVQGFDSQVDQAVSDVQRLNAAMAQTGSLGQSFMQTTGAVALGTMLTRGVEMAGRAAVEQVKNIISAGLDASKLRAEFNTLTGDKSIGEALFGDINKYVADSIFGTEQFGIAKTLMSYGLEADKVLETLKTLGDISMGDVQKLQSLSLAYGQTMAAGKLAGGDLLQYISAGFNPLQEIERTTGTPYAKLREMMEKSQISAEMVAKAFKSATGEGGRWFKMLDQIGDTPYGKLNAMLGNIEMSKQKLGEALLPAVSDFLEASKPLIDELPKFFAALKPSIEGVIKSAVSLTKWVSKNTDTVSNLAHAVKLGAEAYVVWKAGTVAFTGAQWLYNKSIETTISLRTAEATATNAAALSVERLAAANATAVASSGLVNQFGVPVSSAMLAGAGASAAGAAEGAAAGVAGVSVLGGALLVTLAAGSVMALAYAMSDRKNATKYIGSGEATGIQSGLTNKFLEAVNAGDKDEYYYDEKTGKSKRRQYRLGGYQTPLSDLQKSQQALSDKLLTKYNATQADVKKAVGKTTKTTTSDPLKQDIAKITGQQVKNIYVTINGGLVHEFTVKTTTLKESKAEIKRLVTEALTDSINDSQIID